MLRPLFLAHVCYIAQEVCWSICCLCQVAAICQLKAEVDYASKQLETVSQNSLDQLQLNLSQLQDKLSLHIKQLRANDPLYKQIPYLSTGMEQEDCSIPAAAWQHVAQQTDDMVHGVSSHAVMIDQQQLEDLQAAFAQLESQVPDPAVLKQHIEMADRAEELLRISMQLRSWSRALVVCQKLHTASNNGGSATETQQMLASELAALCANLSPDGLAVLLQHHQLSLNSGSVASTDSVLPAGFLQQMVAGYAAYRLQQLKSTARMSRVDVATLCRSLQLTAEGSSSILRDMGSTLIGQYDMLQLLYRQAAALADPINSGMTQCTAVLEPVSFTFLDAAALVAPTDMGLLLQVAGCSPLEGMVSQVKSLAEQPPAGVADFAYPGARDAVAEVFGTADWLQHWKQRLPAAQIVAGTAKAVPLLLPEISAAMTVTAACAAAAGSFSSNSRQFFQLAAVRASVCHTEESQQQLSELDAQRTAAQNALKKISSSP